MLPIQTMLGSMMFLFAVVGSLRGWAKEIIVVFSVIMALFVEHVLLKFLPPVRALFDNMASPAQFLARSILFLILVVFGYASPSIVSKFGARVVRERLQDLLLGFFLGLINGFLIVGTLFSFLNAAHYGVAQDMWYEQQKVDAAGQPVLDRNGQPAIEIVYVPGAKGVGGITPPAPGSPAANMITFLPPDFIARSNATLYVAVAFAFVFVIVVFI